jgi:hypothetical protein
MYQQSKKSGVLRRRGKVKKIVSVFMSVCILLSILPIQVMAVTAKPFQDVPQDAWYVPAVNYVVQNQLMNGTAYNLFSPNKQLTRAQMVQILYNKEGRPEVASDSFSDVNREDWYYSAVNWAADNKIVNGVGNGKFSPNSPITREQMVRILYTYAAYIAYDTEDTADLSQYSDFEKVSEYAYRPMQWAVCEKIVSGVAADTLAPKNTATRAQAAQILMKFCINVDTLEAFQEKDIEDFSGQTVLQYSQSDTTNFSVLSEDTIVADCSDAVNLMVHEDDTAGVYTFGNADDTIKSLTPGDIVFIPYADDPFMAKVEEITVDGTEVTITAADAVLDDFFSYIDVDMEIAGNVDEYGFSPDTQADKQIVLENSENNVYRLKGMDPYLSEQAQKGETIGDEYEYHYNVAHEAGCFSASLDIGITVTARIRYDKYIWENPEMKLSVRQESVGEVKVTAKTEEDSPYRKDLGSVSIPFAPPFEAEVSFFATFDVDAEATGTLTATFSTEVGGMFRDGELVPITDSDGDLTADISGKVTASAGLGASAGINCDIKLVEVGASLSGEAGVILTGTAEKIFTTDRVPEKHLCPLCVDGDMDFYIDAKINADVDTVVFKDWHDEVPLWNKVIPFKSFYISFGGGETPVEFGWGDCPHYEYLVTILTKDMNKKPISDIPLQITGLKNITGSTNNEGEFYTYCKNGSYTVEAKAPEGYIDAEKDFTVTGKPVSLELSIIKDSPVNAVEIWEEFIVSGQYRKFTSQMTDYEGNPLEAMYSIVDIDGDGWEEMILNASLNDGIGFGRHAVLSCDKGTGEISFIPIKGRLIGNNGYSNIAQNCRGVHYFPKFHAISYTEFNNGMMYQDYGFWTIQDGKLEESFSLEMESGAGEGTKFYLLQGGEKINITQEEYEAYWDEGEKITFKSFPAN